MSTSTRTGCFHVDIGSLAMLNYCSLFVYVYISLGRFAAHLLKMV